MPMRTRFGKLVLTALLILTGCPKRFDLRAETVKGSPDPEADHLYREARARLEVGDLRDAQTRFADFLQKYPNDPLAPQARLGEARASLGLGEGQKAKELVEPMAAQPAATEPATEAQNARARYVLGLALHKTGEWERSRALLRPFVSQVGSEDAAELHAVLADDDAHLGDVADALSEYALFFPQARPVERLYIRDRAAALVGQLSPGEALKLWNLVPKDGLQAAFLGKRVAADREKAGDPQLAREVLGESKAARERFGLVENLPRASTRDTEQRVMGLLLPLSGRSRAYGERALRGALLAADLLQATVPAPSAALELRVRDTGSNPDRAAQAVEELQQEGVVALLGPPDAQELQQAVPRAESLGVPLLDMAPDPARRGQLVFKLVRPRAHAADALTRAARQAGARTAAILAPDSDYGRQMAQAFTEAARAQGLTLVADVRFPQTSTTFIDPVKRLQAAHPDALLIPAAASQLALIAPQLSASGLTRVPGVKPLGKLASIYATCDGINSTFLNSTTKYLEGAVLGPAFYADLNNPLIAAFLERYRAAYGEEPTALDAIAYDAVRAVRVALDHEGGVATRAQAAGQLSRLAENGLTGELGFGPTGERAGSPTLYLVEGGALRALK